MADLVDAEGAGGLCKTDRSPAGVGGAVYRWYVKNRGAPDAVKRDVATGRKLYDPDAVRAWHASRPGQGARTDLKEKQ